MTQKAIQNKICDTVQLMRKVSIWKFFDKKIIFTNGCFDILHAGHVHLLNEAVTNKKNSALIVALNSDASVKRLKGKHRPVNNFNDRAYILASLRAVDAVIGFDEDTPLKLIEMIEPDVLIKGGDWKENEIVGSEIVKNNKGIIEIIPYLEGYSTTKILEKIKSL